MRRFISIALAIVVAVAASVGIASPIAAHGPCHPPRTNTGYESAGTFLYASEGNVYDGVAGLFRALPNLHVQSGSATRTGIKLYTPGSYGKAEMRLSMGSDGEPDLAVVEFRDSTNNLDVYELIPLSGTVNHFEIRSSVNFGVRNFRFYINGHQVASWAEWPLWTPDATSVWGAVWDTRNQFLGGQSDHFDWENVTYWRNGNAFAWPTTATVYGQYGWKHIKLDAGGNIDFWDQYC